MASVAPRPRFRPTMFLFIFWVLIVGGTGVIPIAVIGGMTESPRLFLALIPGVVMLLAAPYAYADHRIFRRES